MRSLAIAAFTAPIFFPRQYSHTRHDYTKNFRSEKAALHSRAQSANSVASIFSLQEDGKPAWSGQAVASVAEIILLGLGVGIMVGLMGSGGGIVLVPALVYLLRMDQHMAQGTSLFLQLPPIGIGALYLYWKRAQVDLRAGLVCAAGFLAGGYLGSFVAIGIPSRDLRALFGLFLMFAAAMLVRQSDGAPETSKTNG